MKVKSKYVVCSGCNKGYTITYKLIEMDKKCLCPYCGKYNVHIFKKKK